jgi:hypothetical protein
MKKFSPAPAFLLGALVFLFISGCNLLGNTGPKLAESINLDQTSLTLAVGKTAQLTATVGPSDVDDPTVNWASLNPAVARVSDGLVTAVAEGTTTITATTRDGTNKKAACAVTVTGSETTSYTVTSATVTGGSISVNPTNGTEGTIITVTASPASGYRLKAGTLKYNGTVIDGPPPYTFPLPAANVTVSAEFEATDEPTYTVTDTSGTGGSISVNPASGTAGTTITVTATPASGYQLKSGTLKYNDGTTDYPISGITFVLPATNVTVSAEFEATYTVTDASGPGGNITVSPTSGTAGTTITVTPNPASGYQLKALKYNDGTTDYPISGTTFTLPATNVTVSAEFEVISGTGLAISFAGFGDEEIGLSPDSITLSKSNYGSITVSVTENWDSVNWYVDGANWGGDTEIGLSAFSYPVGKHTVTAVVKQGTVFYSKTLHFEVVR